MVAIYVNRDVSLTKSRMKNSARGQKYSSFGLVDNLLSELVNKYRNVIIVSMCTRWFVHEINGDIHPFPFASPVGPRQPKKDSHGNFFPPPNRNRKKLR